MIEEKDSFSVSNLMLRGDLFHFDIEELTDGKSPVGEGPEGRLDLNVGLNNADKTHPVEHPDHLE